MNLTYDGNAKTASVAVNNGIDGMGAITVKYYDADGNPVQAPTNAGTYAVKIDVAEGNNCKAITDLEIDEFTIAPKTLKDADLTIDIFPLFFPAIRSR